MSDYYQTLAFYDLPDPEVAVASVRKEIAALGLDQDPQPDEVNERGFRGRWMCRDAIFAHIAREDAPWAIGGEITLFGPSGLTPSDVSKVTRAICTICEFGYDLSAQGPQRDAFLTALSDDLEVQCENCLQSVRARRWDLDPPVFGPDVQVDFRAFPDFPQHAVGEAAPWRTDIIGRIETAVGQPAEYPAKLI